MNGLLEGRVAAVTGAARGLGFAIARTFVAQGARVVLGDLDRAALDEAVVALGGEDHARAVRCDAADGDEVATLVATARELGSLDVLVTNAGITRDATLRSMSEEQFDDVVRVHLKGCWWGLKHAVPVMREQGRGSVITMSSIAGKVGNIGQTNYAAAKAGIVGMTKAAAKESARYGVRVNAIQPGIIRTAMTEAMPAHVWEAKVADIPLGRVGEPSEIASVALFLASDLSSYMTGTVTEVTGGRLM